MLILLCELATDVVLLLSPLELGAEVPAAVRNQCCDIRSKCKLIHQYFDSKTLVFFLV